MKAMTALVSLIVLTTPALAAGSYNRCKGMSTSAPLPAECMVAKKQVVSSIQTQTYTVSDIATAIQVQPKPVKFRRQPEIVKYDLKVENVCDKPDSLATISDTWVHESDNDLFSPLVATQRSIAMVGVVTTPGEKSGTKEISVPVIAKSNFGTAVVQNCDGTIMSDIPAHAKISLRFELKRHDGHAFTDKLQKFETGMLQMTSSGLTVSAGVGAFGPVGLAVSPVVSYFAKDTDAIKNFNTGVNTMLSSMDEDLAPNPIQRSVAAGDSALQYRAGKKIVITVSKITYETSVAMPFQGWASTADDFDTTFMKGDSIYNLATAAKANTTSPYSEHLAEFCSKLSTSVSQKTHGDQFAYLVGTGIVIADAISKYELKPEQSCLNANQVATLKAKGFILPGQTDTQNVASSATDAPSKQVRAKTRKVGSAAREQQVALFHH